MEKIEVINRALAINEDSRMLREELALIWDRALDWYEGGDILEVGAYKGATSFVLANIIEQKGYTAKLWVEGAYGLAEIVK